MVGVGASAGGLEAFTQLLQELPNDSGMAFVLVQHLAPTHESMLRDILSTATEMPVVNVQNRMRVEPNRVYVIPPNANMGIMNGELHLMPRGAGQHMPIDFFFRTLAQEQRGGAIGVILSGTASDGANGLKAIKAEGGIAIAQDPETAKFDGMPRASIAAAAVDFVLPVGEIARELVHIGQHPYVRLQRGARAAATDLPEVDDHLNRIFFILRSVTGVDFTYYKHATIKRRLKRRMVLHKLDRISDYVVYLQQNPPEVELLYQDILINVTGFFRDPDLFDALKRYALPQILEHRTPDAPIRVWIPGCSTGEEAFSFAIALLEFLDEADDPVPIQIFATDISQSAIDRARVGRYPESIAADVSPERLRRFFSKSDDGYRISKSVRDLCVFARQDLTKDPPFSRLDLVSCRNLLIYLGGVLQKRVMSILHYALKPAGVLVLGASETIGPNADFFLLLDKKHKIYSCKPAAGTEPLDFSSAGGAEKSAPAKRAATSPVDSSGLEAQIDRRILERYVSAAVVVGANLDVVQFRGETSHYLAPAPGEASLNLLKMAREGLGLELRTAIHAARKSNAPVRKEGLRIRRNGGYREVAIEVLPMEIEPGQRHFLVTFQEADDSGLTAASRPSSARARSSPRATARVGRSTVARLERELGATREYLQNIIQDQEATNEELQSANEEVLSSNEELQSTNEELETAKEELQSTNEELNTVNEELQNRNQELGLANSDLVNLLGNVQMPIVMVNIDLKIRRYTPMAVRMLNLIPSDLGRSIGDIKPSFKIDSLEAIISHAIDTVTVSEQEVEDFQGRWHQMRVRPYKNLDNKIDGAVITFVDIDAVKRWASRLVEAADAAVEGADLLGACLVVLDERLRIRRGSRAFFKQSGISPGDADGQSLIEGPRGPWDFSALRPVLQRLIHQPGAGRRARVTSDGPESGYRYSASRIDGDADGSALVLVTIRRRQRVP